MTPRSFRGLVSPTSSGGGVAAKGDALQPDAAAAAQHEHGAVGEIGMGDEGDVFRVLTDEAEFLGGVDDQRFSHRHGAERQYDVASAIGDGFPDGGLQSRLGTRSGKGEEVKQGEEAVGHDALREWSIGRTSRRGGGFWLRLRVF